MINHPWPADGELLPWADVQPSASSRTPRRGGARDPYARSLAQLSPLPCQDEGGMEGHGGQPAELPQAGGFAFAAQPAQYCSQALRYPLNRLP